MLTNSWEGQPVRLSCHRFTGLLVGTFGIRGLNLSIPPMKFDYYLRVSLEPLAPPTNLFEARCCQWSWKFEGCFHFDILSVSLRYYFSIGFEPPPRLHGAKESGVCFRSIHDVHRDQCQDKVGTVLNGDPGRFIDDVDYQVVVFQYFCTFIPTWGNDSIWRACFSDGLKPD